MKKLLILTCLVAGIFALEDRPEPVEMEPVFSPAYVFKCNTDQECFDEEEACLKSGECVRNR